MEQICLRSEVTSIFPFVYLYGFQTFQWLVFVFREDNTLGKIFPKKLKLNDIKPDTFETRL
jgi:hypothetical protein